MTMQESAQRVADKLWATERAIDSAMVEAVQLIEAMISARRELKLSGTVGEVAQARAAEAIAALSEARRSVMATHAALAAVQKRMPELATVAGSDEQKIPTQAEAEEVTHLRVAS